MAIEVGDLWPFASGTSSLGAEMTNGGFAGEIRPFAHVHMLSGVFQDPVQAMSGIIRYARKGIGFLSRRGLEMSFDGGLSFPVNFYENLTALNPPSYSFLSDANWSWQASGSLGFASLFKNISFTTLDFDFTGFDSNIVFTSFSDCSLSAFQASGRLNYRFGPHQSWHMKTSHSSTGGPANDGYWPIAHSGNVAQMIAQAAGGGGSLGLQNSYQAHRLIIPTTSPGDLQLISNTAKTKFSTFGTQAELNVSGLFTPPTLSNLETGDIYMMNHSVISGIVGTTTSAVARAKALGHGTPVVQTGSGIVNLMVGSGIAQFFTTSNQTLTSSNATLTSLAAVLEVADQNYSIDAGFVTVYSPGLYKVDYNMSFSKTAGTTPQVAQAQLYRNGNVLQGTSASVILIDTTNANLAGCSKTSLLNMNAGDNVSIQVVQANVASNTIRADRFGCTLFIQKIGPIRGAAGS